MCDQNPGPNPFLSPRANMPQGAPVDTMIKKPRDPVWGDWTMHCKVNVTKHKKNMHKYQTQGPVPFVVTMSNSHGLGHNLAK